MIKTYTPEYQRKGEGVMKAAVCYEFGKPLVVEDVTLDPKQVKSRYVLPQQPFATATFMSSGEIWAFLSRSLPGMNPPAMSRN
jgi:hypothetical protein